MSLRSNSRTRGRGELSPEKVFAADVVGAGMAQYGELRPEVVPGRLQEQRLGSGRHL